MTPRSLRRAAERKATKAARKAAKAANLNPTNHLTNHPVEPTVSQAQLAANRANAQLSTGAVTPTGKAISSRNHTTHGLTAIPCENFQVLPTENQAAYNQLLADYRHEWNPTTATEHDLITRMATHAWLRDRAIRLQNKIIAEVGYEMAVEQRKDFALYMRYYATNAKAYSKAFAEIMRLKNFQANQQKNQLIQERRELETQIRFESQKQKTELHTARLETIQLKQSALKQRLSPRNAPTEVKAAAQS